MSVENKIIIVVFFVLFAAWVVVISFTGGQLIHKTPEIKRAQLIHDTTKPKPPRKYPWYVYNKISHKWAVIDSAVVDNHKDTIWQFYGSQDRYNKLLEAMGAGIGGGYIYGGVTLTSGRWTEVEDSSLDVTLGGEFQFKTLDSAKYYFNKYLKKIARQKFIEDSINNRRGFVYDSTMKHDHTYIGVK